MIPVVHDSTLVSSIFKFSTDPTKVLPFSWQAFSQRMEPYVWTQVPGWRFCAPYSSLGLTAFFTGFSRSACPELSFPFFFVHQYLTLLETLVIIIIVPWLEITIPGLLSVRAHCSPQISFQFLPYFLVAQSCR